MKPFMAPRAYSDEVHDLGAAPLTFERTFDGFHLATDAADAVQQLGFFADRVGHGFLGNKLPYLFTGCGKIKICYKPRVIGE
jgi:hypothetical protein